MDEPERYRQDRLEARTAKYHAEVQRLRELRNDQVCGHGVHPSNCNDHRAAHLAAKNGLTPTPGRTPADQPREGANQ